MAIYRAYLENRAVLKVTGTECEDFLQNLVTQDVTRARAQAAALLTPQGKLAFDFILQPVDAGFLIDCASDNAEAFVKKLNLYKLRRNVEITLTDIPVQVVWSDTPDTKKQPPIQCCPIPQREREHNPQQPLPTTARVAHCSFRCLSIPRATTMPRPW